MVVVTDDDVEGSQHGDEDDKIVFDELHTEIANCIEALQHAIYEDARSYSTLSELISAQSP